MDFTKITEHEDYDFLRNEPHLKDRIILLGMGGSYSYGTNVEGSDIDIRGICLNSQSDLIGFSDFEQYVDEKTDTTVYSLKKIFPLLLSCNPNTIEMLGLNEEHYIYLNETGRSLINNGEMFLSKRAAMSFGGYADAQLRRLQNAVARDRSDDSEKLMHIQKTLDRAMQTFNERYAHFEKDSIRIYIDGNAENGELFTDVRLMHYPLREYNGQISEITAIVRDYDKLAKRNRKKDDLHLNKHAMHLLRLFMMSHDILAHHRIATFRKNEHDFLMSVRNGKYMNSDGTFNSAFYDILNEYEKQLRYDADNTDLPDAPDMKKAEEFYMEINRKVINASII